MDVRHFTARALRSVVLALALGLGVAPGAAAASLADTLKDAVKPEQPVASQPPRAPSLEQEIAELRQRLEHGDSGSARARAAPLGATADESAERDRLLRALARAQERRLTALEALKELRQAQEEHKARAEAWQGFSEETEFSIDLVDNLRAATAAKRQEIQAGEVELTLVADYLADFQSQLRGADQKLRRANERLEQAPDGADAERLHWLRELAELRLRYVQAAVARYDAQRTLIEETVAHERQTLALLQRRAAVASEKAPLTRAELDAKLEQVVAERDALAEEIAAAEKADAAAQAALQRARAKLREARDGAPTDAQPAAIAGLQARTDVRKVEADVAAQAVEALKLLQDASMVEENVWQSRFDARHAEHAGTLEQSWDRLTATLSRVALWKRYISSNHRAAQALNSAQKLRLADWREGEGDLALEKRKLAAYEQGEALAARLLEKTHAIEQLVHRYREELQERREAVPMQEQVSSFLDNLRWWAWAAWNLELFTVEDTLTVDGQEVTGERSVTVSKVATVILIVAAGLWLSGVVARGAESFMMRRLQFEPHAAVLLYRVLYGALVMGLLIFALTSVQIPLTVFAFLGGALAIGIGFGAQNLINNFISGVILLLERPIKHGDIVDVEGVRGKLTAIGGRCSTVRSFDGVDMLIPNSAFLEKNVVNWTLADMKRRIDIKVGVSYGSPTREVTRLIEYAVESHGRILSDPSPLVTFSDFGDHALIFTVYFWVELNGDTDPRVVASDVRHRIDRLFREAGITIAYPQRDVHVSASGPIAVQIVSGPDPASSAEVSRRGGEPVLTKPEGTIP